MTNKRKKISNLSDTDTEPLSKLLKTNQNGESEIQSELTKLKLFVEKNQNLKQIAWQTSFIKDFHDEIIKNGINNNNFNLFSKFLETSAILYSHKIDILYDEMLRMKLNFQNLNNATSMIKDKKRDENVTRKLNIRKNNFLTKNPEILNKSFQKLAFRDPIFAKMEESVENNVSKLLYNKLPLSNGCYNIPEISKPFWDSSNDYEENLSISEPVIISNVFITTNDTEGFNIRTTLKNYEITNLPYVDEISECIIILDSDEEMVDLNISSQQNDSAYMSDLSRNNTMQMSNTDSSDFGDIFNPLKYSSDYSLSQDLEPQVNEISTSCFKTERNLEMMPKTVVKFEYSYQSLNKFEDVSSSPSHWKFLTSTPKKKNARLHYNRQTKTYNSEVTLDYICQSRDKISNVLLKTSNNTNSPRMFESWKNIKLNDDINLENIFNSFFSSPFIDINKPICNTLMPSSSSFQDFDNELNSDCYSQDVFDNFNDTGNEISIDLNSFPSNLHLDNFKVCDIFSSKKKVINMKLINETTLTVIESECLLNYSKSINFKSVCKKSSKLLKECNENTSAAVIFQSILQNANDGKFKIASTFNNIKDFDIIFTK
ncbi:hypothetical protein PVAND_009459 [Polypedilum vanderplanki]|uniref:Condensin complex subunit 2 n=1 Tax=Polypedilum vanderplanki TaxID=319348 RepID=A0A9J6CDT1_POLVA|nr:hypothetical protein PVAND_009459 [Polypedilum vanderplanki]